MSSFFLIWESDSRNIVDAENLPCARFHRLPSLHFAGKDIRKTFNASDLHFELGRPNKTP